MASNRKEGVNVFSEIMQGNSTKSKHLRHAICKASSVLECSVLCDRSWTSLNLKPFWLPSVNSCFREASTHTVIRSSEIVRSEYLNIRSVGKSKTFKFTAVVPPSISIITFSVFTGFFVVPEVSFVVLLAEGAVAW